MIKSCKRERFFWVLETYPEPREENRDTLCNTDDDPKIILWSLISFIQKILGQNSNETIIIMAKQKSSKDLRKMFQNLERENAEIYQKFQNTEKLFQNVQIW